VEAQAKALQTAWTGGFADELSKAGDGSMVYANAQAGLNALSDAMFYLEKTTKDMKMGTPVGLINCATDLCLDDLESRYARVSKEHVIANVQAFEALFTAGGGYGFDDLLKEVGAEKLASDIAADLQKARTALDAIPGDLNSALQNNKPLVLEAYNALVDLNLLIKTQFLSVLDLEIPARAASDND
jgi:hypothetical protein